MKRFTPLSVLMVVFVGINGCRDNSANVAVVQPQTASEDVPARSIRDVKAMFEEMIRLSNEMGEAMERGEPDAKLNELTAKVETIQKHIADYNLSADEKELLSKQFQAELAKVSERVDKAAIARLEKIYGRKMDQK